MLIRLLAYGPFRMLSAGLALVVLVGSPAYAQFKCCIPQWRQPWSDPNAPEAPATPPIINKDPNIPDATPAPQPAPETARALTPNMFGNLLGAGRSVSFFVNRTQGTGFVYGAGTTNAINSKVADNNSPIPQDRVGFRYNFFSQAQSVTGISNTPPRFDPDFIGNIETPLTKKYDVNMYTFDFEKTFFDGLVSVQARIPFSRRVGSNLNLNYGTIDRATALIPGTNLNGVLLDPAIDVLNVTRTPTQTLGNEDTEFGNMQLILKGLLYQTSQFALSAGVSLGIPTAPDTNVHVTDFGGNARFNNAELQRVRDFHIDNATWSLSPFLAFAAAPNERWFTQGFLQFEVPLNKSDVTYNVTYPKVRTGLDLTRFALPTGGKIPPFEEQTSIREQTLMHLDLGVGYWLMQRPQARWLTGIAPTVELHYTTTLQNADIATFSRDILFAPNKLPNGNFDPNVAVSNLKDPPQSQVGNQRGRMDILDLTTGCTFLLGDRSSLGVGVSVPLRGASNRTYEWEFQVQYNWYFGAPRQVGFTNFQ